MIPATDPILPAPPHQPMIAVGAGPASVATPTPRMGLPASPPPTGVVLSGRHLRKCYGSAVALSDASLDLHRAESVAVTGSSGSGKTTLLHCLAGIQPPDVGEVWLGQQRIDGRGEAERTEIRRTRFGFVFQSGQLLPELQAVENVALPLMLGGSSRRRAVRIAEQWFDPLGIGGLEHRRPGELSGGQAQRVAIARALVMQPAVVFADEPTAALDHDTGRATIDLLIEACRRSGSAALIVTHNPEIASACDRRVEIRDGLLGANAPRWPGPARAAPDSRSSSAVHWGSGAR